MNIMQYFTKEGLEKYLTDNGITKIIAEPIFEDKLNDLAEEVVYFSAVESAKTHNEGLSKQKKTTRGERPITSSEALQTKLEEIGATEMSTIVRVSDKSVKLGGEGKSVDKIHRVVFTPPNPS